MAKIKITDLPKDLRVTREEMRRACGGELTASSGPVSIYGGIRPQAMYGSAAYPYLGGMVGAASPKTYYGGYGAWGLTAKRETR